MSKVMISGQRAGKNHRARPGQHHILSKILHDKVEFVYGHPGYFTFRDTSSSYVDIPANTLVFITYRDPQTFCRKNRVAAVRLVNEMNAPENVEEYWVFFGMDNLETYPFENGFIDTMPQAYWEKMLDVVCEHITKTHGNVVIRRAN